MIIIRIHTFYPMSNHYFWAQASLMFFLVLVANTWQLGAQINPNKPIARIVAERQQQRSSIPTFRPLNPAQENNFSARTDLHSYLRDGIILTPDTKHLNGILSSRPNDLRLSLPLPNGENVALSLFKAQVLTDQFRLTIRNERGEQPEHYVPGAYYRGIVEGNPNSVAAISFFDNGDIMGIFSTDEGNFVIGRMTDQLGRFILYNDRDLLVTNPFNCAVTDEHIDRPIPEPAPNQAQLRSEACGKLIRAYLECDFELYQAKSSNVTTTTNYATGAYNNVAAIYQNESISTQVSEVFVWTTADSYPAASDPNAILAAFGTLRQDTFNGDLAHLLSGVSSGGYSGLAWLGVLCNTYWAPQQSGRFAYSQIAHSYQALPTYSWTVGCITHEMGHNLGSPHTHSCCWTGGALDNCVAVESCGSTSCSPGPAPVNGGTIMSYCHITGAGINFNNGFGTQPGDLIRAEYNAAACLPGDVPPVASFTNTPVSGLAVSFNATATGANNTYSWNFGDPASGASNTATGANATHTFSAAGTYSVALTVSNDCGSDIETLNVIVTNYTPPVVCSGAQTINNCSGVITDGSSGDYANNKNCTWLIAPTGASSVTLTFTLFNTEADWDFVDVYNGSNASAPLLGSYSGTSLPPTLTATSGQMFVRFTSDVSVVDDGFSANYSCTIPEPTGNKVQAKIYLEGAYNTTTNSMVSDLNTSLPLAQPFNAAPWNYAGTESIAATNNNIIDWVLVELYDGTSSTPIARKAALLYTDGTIHHTDGSLGADFGNNTWSAVRLSIRHRNHLPVMSKNTINVPNLTPYDFTTSVSQADGDAQMREIEGVAMMRAGDFNSDGTLTYIDYNLAISQLLSGSPTNYVTGDANLDRNITNTDFALYLNNLSYMSIPLLRY